MRRYIAAGAVIVGTLIVGAAIVVMADRENPRHLCPTHRERLWDIGRRLNYEVNDNVVRCEVWGCIEDHAWLICPLPGG